MRFGLIFTNLLCFFSLFAAPTTTTLNIKVDQFGYRPADKKVAVIAQPQTGQNAPSSYTPSSTFKIRRWSDDAEVFSGAIVAKNGGTTHAQSGDKVWWFDFTSLTDQGDFYVYDPTNNVGSHKFTIQDNIYSSVLQAATKAFFFQRCGTAISATHGGAWTHTICHAASNQDAQCRDVENQGNGATAQNLVGGWHDAGDYNKYVNFTYNTLHNLLFAYQEAPSVFGDNLNIPESGNGIPDLLDEIKYELDWLIKMQQSNGSVLSKVSVTDFSAASPPSGDGTARYWGRASTSSTLTVASVFAHAYLVMKDVGGLSSYANTLLTKAELAWTWANANPSVTYANTGFQSATPEINTYETAARKTCAAALLYAATNNNTYKTHFESNYLNLQPMQWYYFYPFEATHCDILLFYTTLSGGTASVKSEILSRFSSSVNNNGDFFPNFTSETDPYRAYMKNDDYVWGNNQHKAWVGCLYESMIRYNQSPSNHTNYRIQALDYLHYLHGVNPLSQMMLSNMSSYGSDNGGTQIYHAWVGDGTSWDNNPIPAFVTGGANKNYGGNQTPPLGQPVQKSYKDWNTGWPENSWEITEPAIYYQAAYVRLVAKYATTNTALPVELSQFGVEKQAEQALLRWQIERSIDLEKIEIERSADGHNFKKIGEHNAVKAIDNGSFLDKNPLPAANFYRLRLLEYNGKFQFSPIRSVVFDKKHPLSIFPNPANNVLKIESKGGFSGQVTVEIFDLLGKLVLQKNIQIADFQELIELNTQNFAEGTYVVKVYQEVGVSSFNVQIVK
jgi:endoglucanase